MQTLSVPPGRGFPGDSVIKNLPVSVGDAGSIPGLGRVSREGNGTPLQYSCLENSMDRETWKLQSMALQRVGLSKFHFPRNPYLQGDGTRWCGFGGGAWVMRA